MYIGKTQNAITVILLSIVTCGIYGIYWLYTAINDINSATDQKIIDNPTMYLVLSIICFPFYWVTLYKIDKALAELCPKEGVTYKENFMLWILLAVLAGIGTFFAMFNVIDAFNAVWANRSENNINSGTQF